MFTQSQVLINRTIGRTREQNNRFLIKTYYTTNQIKKPPPPRLA